MSDFWLMTDLCTPWCVHVAATLNVAEHIERGKAEIAELATACGADADALHRVLRHLASRGLFRETRHGHFELTELARPLLQPTVRSGLDLDGFGGRMAHSWNMLLKAVRTGKSAYHEIFGRSFWDDLEQHPAIGAAFDDLMGPGHGTPDPNVLADPAEWNSIRSVVDVGGGAGYLLAEILKAHPRVRGVLVDLARPVAASAEVFAAAGVTDRATAIAQTFFDPLPAGHDLYVLKSILSDWPDPEALALLRRCAEAARPSNGRVVVFTIAGPGEEAPPELLMLVLVGGKARTLEEFRGMAEAAGLEVRATGKQASGRTFVECSVRA